MNRLGWAVGAGVALHAGPALTVITPIRRGHEGGVHGWHHGCLLWRTPTAVQADLARAKDLIGTSTKSAHGIAPR